jgi:hypothetical protein
MAFPLMTNSLPNYLRPLTDSSPGEAQRARLRAARQERNALVLRVARSIPCPFCACSSKDAWN